MITKILTKNSMIIDLQENTYYSYTGTEPYDIELNVCYQDVDVYDSSVRTVFNRICMKKDGFAVTLIRSMIEIIVCENCQTIFIGNMYLTQCFLLFFEYLFLNHQIIKTNTYFNYSTDNQLFVVCKRHVIKDDLSAKFAPYTNIIEQFNTMDDIDVLYSPVKQNCHI